MVRAVKIVSGMAMAAMLSGCVAAVLPVLAAGAMTTSQLRGPKTREAPIAAAPVAAPEVRTLIAEAAAAVAATPMQAPPPLTYVAAATTAAAATALPLPVEIAERAPPAIAAALPADMLGMPPEHAAFVAHVIRRSALVAEGAPVSSLVVANGLTVREIQYVRCRSQVPAVLVDLDDSTGAQGNGAPVADPAMVAALRAVRAEGVTVLWVTDQNASAASAISDGLRMNGLDPDGEDIVLAAANAADRKQLRRFSAASRYCILAVTGDRRSDADEAYDYLRDPNTPLAIDANWGSGWYILPPPMRSPSSQPQEVSNALEP